MGIWAHRGCSMKYPENTLEAFNAAAKLQGIKGIELDVQLTKDGEIVVIHDEDVSRTTDGTAMVREYTFKEIKQLKIEARDGLYASIPALKEVLELLNPFCRKRGLLINIELKNGIIRYEGMEEKVLTLVEGQKMGDYIIYSSFLPASLKLIKGLNPKARTGMLGVTLEDCIKLASEVNADDIHPYVGGLHGGIPKEWKNARVRAWNGEEPLFGMDNVGKKKSIGKFEKFGVTDIFTNAPEEYLNEAIDGE